MPTPTRPLDDDALLDIVQRQTLKYFWDFAHPVSGLARERSNVADHYGLETVTSGGSGMGVMAIIAGVERGWIARAAAAKHLLKAVRFLARASAYHGVFPHFLDGETGRTVPFSRKDDGGDIVETSFLMAGLLCARQYFDGGGEESALRGLIESLWSEVEWNWHTRDGEDGLYWHWSPNNGWAMNHRIAGWNECLITYVLAASSPRYPIAPDAYHRGWARNGAIKNGKRYFGIELPLGPEFGGPMFFAHYSFLGLDPRGLKDRYADYWQQNRAHTAINRAHCLANPNRCKGYGDACWGLTASDNDTGYSAHAPDNDLGIITPTAALGSMPYAPEESMRALRHFYEHLGPKIWGDYGFRDSFSESRDWVASSYLAIDQGPIVVMIENHRSGLLWRLFMSCPEVQAGLKTLGFTSPHIKA